RVVVRGAGRGAGASRAVGARRHVRRDETGSATGRGREEWPQLGRDRTMVGRGWSRLSHFVGSRRVICAANSGVARASFLRRGAPMGKACFFKRNGTTGR